MNNIIEPSSSFNFNQLSLGELSGIQGGAYFTKLYNVNGPFYIQTPKSLTKQGIVRTDKKAYIDLMFNNSDKEFIEWIENLEQRCHDLIFEKSDEWFAKKQTKDDIETAFASPIRIFKSGKYYLLRLNIKLNPVTNTTNIKLYNENQESKTVYDITSETNIISIIELQGIKFTSQNFQLEMELKQAMIHNPEKIFDSCLIKPFTTSNKSFPMSTTTTTDVSKTNIVEDTTSKTTISSSSSVINKNQPYRLDDEAITLDEVEVIPNNLDNSITKTIKQDDVDKNNNDEAGDGGDSDNETIMSGSIEDDDVETEDEDAEEDERPFKKIQLGDLVQSSTTLLQQQKKDFKEDSLEEIDIMIEPSVMHINDDELKEIDINPDIISDDKFEAISLKKSHSVYVELYKKAYNKAKLLKQESIMAFLEAKNIKKTYMLDDLTSDSDDENVNELSGEDNLDDLIK